LVLEEAKMTWQDWGAIATIIGSFVTFGTLIFLAVQILLIARINRGQNTIAIMEFLQRPEVREARRHVLTLKRDLADYNDIDRTQASLVASSYDVAGLMVENGYIDKHVVIDAWGFSIVSTFKLLSPYLEDKRKRDGVRLWVRYDSLARDAHKFHAHYLNE
jgi:hypothetical protein